MSIRKLNVFRRVKKAGLPRLISDLFNPLFVQAATLILAVILLEHSLQTIIWASGLSILLYCLIPLGASVYLLNIDKITSLDIPERRSRTDVFRVAIGCAGIAFAISYLYSSVLNTFIQHIALIFFINSLFGYTINKVWKMSMHAGALASAGAIFLYLERLDPDIFLFGSGIFSLIILLLILPLMIWSRYKLQIHSQAELWGGAASGFAITFLELILLQTIW